MFQQDSLGDGRGAGRQFVGDPAVVLLEDPAAVARLGLPGVLSLLLNDLQRGGQVDLRQRYSEVKGGVLGGLVPLGIFLASS